MDNCKQDTFLLIILDVQVPHQTASSCDTPCTQSLIVLRVI